MQNEKVRIFHTLSLLFFQQVFHSPYQKHLILTLRCLQFHFDLFIQMCYIFFQEYLLFALNYITYFIWQLTVCNIIMYLEFLSIGIEHWVLLRYIFRLQVAISRTTRKEAFPPFFFQHNLSLKIMRFGRAECLETAFQYDFPTEPLCHCSSSSTDQQRGIPQCNTADNLSSDDNNNNNIKCCFYQFLMKLLNDEGYLIQTSCWIPGT